MAGDLWRINAAAARAASTSAPSKRVSASAIERRCRERAVIDFRFIRAAPSVCFRRADEAENPIMFAITTMRTLLCRICGESPRVHPGFRGFLKMTAAVAPELITHHPMHNVSTLTRLAMAGRVGSPDNERARNQMAKGERKSNREVRKPKKTAAEKSSASTVPATMAKLFKSDNKSKKK